MTSELDNLKSALYAIDPGSLSNQQWVEVGMAWKSEGGDFSVWDAWSAQDRRKGHGYPGSNACKARWDGFKRSGVTGGTIWHYAKQAGYFPHTNEALSWDSPIDLSLADEEPRRHFGNPTEDTKRFLRAVFEADEHPCIVFDASYDEQRGKWVPGSKGSRRLSRDELIEKLDKGGIAEISGYEHEAGVWVCVNPMNGQRSTENAAAFRHVLVESDNMPIGAQIEKIKALNLPVSAMTHSGGKSVHALVKVDAKDLEEYRKRVDDLFKYLTAEGFDLDKQNKNPDRLSRLPGVERGEKRQYLIDTNIGAASWAEWVSWRDDQDDLPLVETLDFSFEAPDREIIIDGVAKGGDLMLLTAPSKAGKSFSLMEMAAAISCGGVWFGHQCKEGRVFYANFEIENNEFVRRMKWIKSKIGMNEKNIDIWNMRGHSGDMEHTMHALTCRVRDGNYSTVIIDPLYMLNNGDENNAGDMTKLFNRLIGVAADTETLVVVVHHHSKGVQGGKAAMDRGSGSGVFGRAPDAILDLYELAIGPQIADEVVERYGEDATAWELSYVLRYWPNRKAKRIFFAAPSHVPDYDGLLDGAEYMRESRATGANRQSKEERDEMLVTAFQKLFNKLAGGTGKVPVKTMREKLGVGEVKFKEIRALAGYVSKKYENVWYIEQEDDF